jgi:hypothetical protein
MSVEPAESRCQDGSVVAIFEDEPFFLPDLSFGVVAPEIDSQQFLMGEPDRAMVVVVGRSRMTHSSQRFARWPVEWVEERTWILSSVMPASSLGSIDVDGNLVIGKGNNLTSRK